jgi:hypothetical protein
MIIGGYWLLLFGSLVDIADNFAAANQVFNRTLPLQIVLEKIVGYLGGFCLIALGVARWLPIVAKHEDESQRQCELQNQRLQVLHATMHTVNDIVNNALNNLLLFKIKAEDSCCIDQSSIDQIDAIIHGTSSKLQKISSLQSTPMKAMSGGTWGIDYDQPVANSSTNTITSKSIGHVTR